MNKCVYWVVAATVCCSQACTFEPSKEENEKPLRTDSEQLADGSLRTYSVEAASLGAVPGRARRAAEVLSGRSLQDAAFQASYDERTAGGTVPVWEDNSVSATGIHVRYDVGTDTLLVDDPGLEVGIPEGSERRIASSDAARPVFDRALSHLDAAGLLEIADYDLVNVQVAATKYAEGWSDGPSPEEQVVNYRFTARRMLGNIPVLDADVRIAVHVSGQISSIRLNRAGLTLTERATNVPKLSLAQCQKRFGQEFANSYVNYALIGYVLSSGSEAILEPKCVVSYSSLTPRSDGPSVVGRRQQARYDLLDESAPPTVFPTPDTVPGDPRPTTR